MLVRVWESNEQHALPFSDSEHIDCSGAERWGSDYQLLRGSSWENLALGLWLGGLALCHLHEGSLTLHTGQRVGQNECAVGRPKKRGRARRERSHSWLVLLSVSWIVDVTVPSLGELGREEARSKFLLTEARARGRWRSWGRRLSLNTY